MPLILSNTGQWVTVHAPKGHDPCWREADCLRYAVLCQGAVEKGVDVVLAEVVAEAIVNRQFYPGLVYDNTLEQKLQVICGYIQ